MPAVAIKLDTPSAHAPPKPRFTANGLMLLNPSLIAQALVEVHARQADESWQPTSFDGWQALMRLEELRVEIPLSEIYALTAPAPSQTDEPASTEVPQA